MLHKEVNDWKVAGWQISDAFENCYRPSTPRLWIGVGALKAASHDMARFELWRRQIAHPSWPGHGVVTTTTEIFVEECMLPASGLAEDKSHLRQPSAAEVWHC